MELVYLLSPTRQQHKRAQEVLAAVREKVTDLSYREVDPREDPAYAEQYHIQHAPGIILDGRIEFVGIPREKMLLGRIRQRQAESLAAPEGEESPEDGS